MALADLKRAQRIRLEYLDSLFFWESRANRRDLTDRFDISQPQAALDFKEYLNLIGNDAVEYDGSAKHYITLEGFGPICTPPPLSNWLKIEGTRNHDTFEELPILDRIPDVNVEARLYRAIRDKLSLEVTYQSMTKPRPQKRWIAPQRFASDGNRLHLRAYCFKNEEFRDFVPARIDRQKSTFLSRVDKQVPTDIDWNTMAIVRLSPHSDLSREQARAVRLEYGFQGKYLKIETRKALLFYINRRWGLDHVAPRLAIEEISYNEPTEQE